MYEFVTEHRTTSELATEDFDWQLAALCHCPKPQLASSSSSTGVPEFPSIQTQGSIFFESV
ncbi:hypothetical protein PGTUg99_026486 [Puccinia graminis f. sp. tritici]|uniref:Uncharacterized protein n=1 Tax=Puccinia graminis f. sp. tritici TaxID=56615 RepID=A0A5B0MTE3_PUCGR|nr:hypothetical protein PGTUg99_026486 [Puccinia graminis f. sp. tritici]